MIKRWWTYQRERFPLGSHGILIAAFSFAAVSFSALLRDRSTLPGLISFVVAFATTFIFFLQLRISDEFKDQEDDARFRPYRPVPRGLVSLGELTGIAGIGAIVQFGLALALTPFLLPLLIIVWIYLGLMTKEFFLAQWLRRHPLTYMLSHALVLPLISLYAIACDWLLKSPHRPSGLIWFLGLSFFNALVFEIGRKIRTPSEEESGVETYSSLWGTRNASLAWSGALCLSALAALTAAAKVGAFLPFASLLILVLPAAAVTVGLFLRNPARKYSTLFAPLSALWLLLSYMALGTFPRLLPV